MSINNKVKIVILVCILKKITIFIIFQVLKNKLLSIGIGTLFAFIVVISSIWCISTYYDYKMHEAEICSINTENDLNTSEITSACTLRCTDSSLQHEIVARSFELDFERFPLSRATPDLLSSTWYPPPPYTEISSSSLTSQIPRTLNVTRYKINFM